MIGAAIVGVAIGLAAVASYAQEAPAQAVVDAAEASGVDPVDLAGAVNAMQDAGVEVSPREYLYAVGELERTYVLPPYRVTPSPSVGSAPFGLSGYLAAVAWCESHFRTDVIYGPTLGKDGEKGLFQLKPGDGMLPVFYARGFTNPWNPWQQVEFVRWAFAHGYAGRWSCA